MASRKIYFSFAAALSVFIGFAPTCIAQAAPAATAAPAAAPVKTAPKRKAKAKKKSPKSRKPEPESKYKSRILTENTEHTYRFDAEGNPIMPGAKSSPKKKKKPKEECSAEDSCSPKASSADAL
jgi:hypothetical protein